jgi:hypothetical protein
MSQWVREVLLGGDPGEPPAVADVDLINDDDVQLSLWMIYELHYRGFEDADPDLEWDLRLIGLRREIEQRFEAQLREATAAMVTHAPGDELAEELLGMAEGYDGPSVALYLQREATLEQMQDYLSQRSIVQLKESDPHSFVLGRLDGAPKAALAELQYDEYGGGRSSQLHATLYADALTAAELNPEYGAYLEEATAVTLASANVMSMFAFNRRLRAASMGHLAIFEATSSLPCRRISIGLQRLGLPEAAQHYFDEHVEADAVHEQVAAYDICAAMVEAEPDLQDDVLFGAATCLYMDSAVARSMLVRWRSDLPVAS